MNDMTSNRAFLTPEGVSPNKIVLEGRTEFNTQFTVTQEAACLSATNQERWWQQSVNSCECSQPSVHTCLRRIQNIPLSIHSNPNRGNYMSLCDCLNRTMRCYCYMFTTVLHCFVITAFYYISKWLKGNNNHKIQAYNQNIKIDSNK